MSLALADFLTAITICGIINSTYEADLLPRKFIRTRPQFSEVYAGGFGIIASLSLSASILMLVVISLDR